MDSLELAVADLVQELGLMQLHDDAGELRSDLLEEHAVLVSETTFFG